MTTSIWWIRRDLRLSDNPSLEMASESADAIIPCFVLDDHLLDSPLAGQKRVAFLMEGLRKLDEDLRDRGSRLIVRRGDPLQCLGELFSEVDASGIFAEEAYSPYAHARDASVADALPLQLVPGVTVVPPGGILKQDGDPYVVYTPFSRKWKALTPPDRTDLVSAPAELPPVGELSSVSIPDSPHLPREAATEPGEEVALAQLRAFITGDGQPGVYRYADTRNQIDEEATSGLSPFLRFGMISARRAVVEALEAQERAPDGASRKGAETWLNELIWREFYMHILDHFPYVAERSFRPELQDIEWTNDETQYQAWKDGRTGYPIVDAAMRQLVATGWMHNRSRMVVASFLVKDLLIDWRWGERFFIEHLLDCDLAANNGGWQWSAGTGTDAAPYFRIFNPVLQGKKHDPDGTFVKQWVPELAEVPGEYIHTPWKMSQSEQRGSGCEIGRDYPAPIVDHAAARERTLAAYESARQGPSNNST